MRNLYRHISAALIAAVSLCAHATATENTAYTFPANTGINGQALSTDAVVIVPSGVYGSFCSGDGAGNAGTGYIWKIASGTESVIWDYDTGSGADKCPSNMMVAGSGNIFGTSIAYNSSGVRGGYLWKYNVSTGVYSTVIAYPQDSYAANPIPSSHLVQDSSGNFYGLYARDTATSYYTQLYRVSPSGTFTVLHNFVHFLTYNAELIYGADGNLYVVEATSGIIYQVPATGGSATTFFTYPSVQSLAPEMYVMQASDGNFYGSIHADGGIEKLFKVDSSGNLTNLYSFSSPYGAPYSDLVEGNDGNLYGAARDFTGTSWTTEFFSLSKSGTYTSVYNFGTAGTYYISPANQTSGGKFFAYKHTTGGSPSVYSLSSITP